jgi:hypothetical protein
MKYRNVKTGAVVDVDCELGGAWEPVKAPRPTGATKSGRKSKEEPKEPVKDEKK